MNLPNTNSTQPDEEEKTLTMREINAMDTKYRNAHKALLRIEANLGEKSLYFILKKHYRGRKAPCYKPTFEI